MEELEQKLNDKLEELEIMKQQVQEMSDFIQSLRTDTSIPYDVDQAFRTRFGDLGQSLSVSSKGADSEDQTVSEAGSGTYSVLGDPDGFLEVVINGTTYYLPYY